ncbi:MAG: hypothetical protein EOP17_00950 [Rhizobiaceae bacterium]|nr:MAG: hypothetical protein EOP17_00950 [Rhizobiaceae bacterium]
MLKWKRALALGLGVTELIAPGAASAQTPSASPGLRPPQSQCSAVRDVDLNALQREVAQARALSVARNADAGLPHPDATFDAMFAPVQIPAWAERRPSEDAPVIIRARMPPGGGHGSDHRAVVWRDADGAWWFWRHVINNGPPKPPPVPTHGLDPGSAEGRAWYAAQGQDRTAEERYWPPTQGRLSAARAQQIEAAWTDSCRGWDPDFWPRETPLNRRIDGSRRRLCAQDSSAILGTITESGRSPRRVGAACGGGAPTQRMVEIAVYAAGD